MISFQQLSSGLNQIVYDVGAFIKRESIDFDPEKIEHKGKNDLVSYVDKQAEKKLTTALSELLPGSGFITEEKTISKTGETYNWIIDPLDGTTNFIHHLPVFAISVALQENDRLVAGAVYELNRDELFHAYLDSQAMMNDQVIRVSVNPTLSDALLATGFPYYNFDKVDRYLSLMKKLMQETHGLRRMGSAATDLAYVSCGRFDGYFEFNINSWDVAAGLFLVQQAGGLIANFTGGQEFFKSREVVATNNKIHEEMLTVIKNYFL